MNKFFLASVLVAFISLTAYPDYVPMIREGRVWEYEGYFGRNGEWGQVLHYMKFDGTVTVNDKEYHAFGIYNSKFYQTIGESRSDYTLSREEERNGPVWFLREESGRVYVLMYGDSAFEYVWTTGSLPEAEYDEYVLYDFTLEEGAASCLLQWGNTVPGRMHETVYLDPVMIDGELCKAQSFMFTDSVNGMNAEKMPFYGFGKSIVLEGIGITFNGCLPYFCVDMKSSIGDDNSRCPIDFSWLRSVRNSAGEIIYGQESPAAISEVMAERQSESDIYDVMGRRVDSTVPGSVYIRGGKKFVAR
jgi:hypothetical protein